MRISDWSSDVCSSDLDVLQTAAPVVGRADAEQPLQAVAPGVREIPEIEVALDHRLLQPVAQDDVGRVGDLVRVHADEAPLDPRAGAVEAVRAQGGPR